MSIYNLAWLVVLLPLLGWLFSFLAILPRRSAQICLVFGALSAALALLLLGYRIGHQSAPIHESVIGFWMVSPGDSALFASTLNPLLGIRVDGLSAVLMAVVSLVSLLVQLHGLALMRGDVELRRLFQLLSVLSFATLGFVAAPNLFQLWMLGSVASVAAYLLAAHWWTSDALAAAARRLYLLLAVGDLAMLLVLVFLFVKLGRHASALPPRGGYDQSDPFAFSVLDGEWPLGRAGTIPGVGMRTLALLAGLLLLVGAVRAAQAPLGGWLAELGGAPTPALALVSSFLAGSGLVLLVRVQPLLAEVPHALSAAAAIGALTALLGAVSSLRQTDLVRLVQRLSAAQLGLLVAALGSGGYGRPLLGLVVFLLLAPLPVLAVSHIVHAYRSQEIDEVAGLWPRMPWTVAALVVWAAGVVGASLIDYGTLASVLHNRAPGGQRLAAPLQAAVLLAVLAATVIIAAVAVRLLLRLLPGEAPRRRGVRPERIVEVGTRLRRPLAALALAMPLAVVAGAWPGGGLDRLVHAVGAPEPLAWDPVAALLGLLIAVGGGALGGWLARPSRVASAAVGSRVGWVRALAGAADPSPALAGGTNRLLAAAGGLLSGGDRDLADPLEEAMGRSFLEASGALRLGRSARLGVQLASALTLTLLLAGGLALAAFAHWLG